MSVAAKRIAAKIGTTVVVGLVDWHVRESAVELDATTAADDGYMHPDLGLQGATIEIKGVLDITSGAYSPIKAGTTITNLNLFRDIDDVTPAYTFPSVVVTESSQGAEIRGRFEISATGKSVGSWTYNEPS